MRIRNRRLGMIDLFEEALVRLPGGLLGFEGHEEYFLLDIDGTRPFRWLISRRDPDLVFAAIPPESFLDGAYRPPISEADRRALELEPGGAVEILALVSPGERAGPATANLKGPLVLNPVRRLAKQLIVYGAGPSARHPIDPGAGVLQAWPRAPRAGIRMAGRRAA